MGNFLASRAEGAPAGVRRTGETRGSPSPPDVRSDLRPAAVFPSADQIALAIVTACRLTGDQPIATCMRQTSRARHVAFDALCAAFPEARKQSLARLCGYPTPANWSPALVGAKKAGWWRDAFVDEVLGVLVAGEYGERAA